MMPLWLVPVVFSCDIAQWATMFDRQVIPMNLLSIQAKVKGHIPHFWFMGKDWKIWFVFEPWYIIFMFDIFHIQQTKMTFSNCELYCNIEWHSIAIQSGKNAACGGQLAPATTLHTSIWSQCHYPVVSSGSKGVTTFCDIFEIFREGTYTYLTLAPSPCWKHHLNTSESINYSFNRVSFS